MSNLDPPILVELEPPIIEDYGLSADTMLGWLLEMVNIPKWRPQCDEDHDFYEANQLKREIVDEMKRRQQAPSAIPYCSAAIDIILGMEAQTRTGVKVDTAPGEVTPPVADALTVKLQNAITETNTDFVIAEAYHGQVVGGVDWVEVGRNEDPFKPGKRVAYVPYHEMWWDWRAKDVIIRDARYIVRKKRYDFDMIVSRWPEIAPIITSLGRGNRYQTWDYPQFGAQLNRSTTVDRGLREEEFEWFNTIRKTALVYEVWYKKQTLIDVFYKDEDKAVEFDPNNLYQVEARERGLINVFQAYTQKMRVAFWVGNIRVSDDPTPYPHNEFPYVPFFAFREKRYGSPYGLMRRMRGIQELINNVSSKVHFYMGANQVFYDERAFEDPNMVKAEINKPNFFIPVKADPLTGTLYKVDVQRGSQLLDPHINYLKALIQMFHDVSGIHPASLGSQGAEMSGEAADIARTQDATGLGKVNDNYRQSRHKVHELLLSLVIEDLKDKHNVPVEVAQDIGGPVTVIINQVMEDGSIQNSIDDINVRAVLEDIPKSATWQEAAMRATAEVLKSSPPEVQAMLWPAFIKMSASIPGHLRIADLLAQSTGLLDKDGKPQDPRIKQLQDQLQQLQMELQMKRPPELLAAEIEKTKAETNKILAEVKETVAKSVETTIRSFFEASNTAAVIASNTSVAPVSDHLLVSAGFQHPMPVGESPGIPQAGVAAPIQFPGNKHPNTLPGPETPETPQMPSPAAPRPPRNIETPEAGLAKGVEGGQKPEAA